MKQFLNFTSAEISADESFPMEIYCCVLYSGSDDNNPYSVMPVHPFHSGWGIGSGKQVCLDDTVPFTFLKVAWLSLREQKFFYGKIDFSKDFPDVSVAKRVEGLNNLVIGLAPAGKIALWANNEYKSVLIGTKKADELEFSISEFLEYDYNGSINDYCQHVLADCGLNKDQASAPEFEKRMKQYLYRFSVCFNDKKEYTTGTLNTFYANGSYNRLNDEESFSFRNASIPKKINLGFNKGKQCYTLGLFFDLNSISDIFSKFYGAHPETKTDFIIRIDAENREYELSLYRQGLKNPVIIPETAYQFIVFKNKFEDCRSDNYNQPRGAWIW